jgi:AraC-like DNA-binding protein
MNVDAWSERFAVAPAKPPKATCFDLARQAETLALANPDQPLNIAALCHLLGVSERTLRKAFRITYGLSPCRHLRMLRLLRVRQALLSPSSCQAPTVTEIATRFGFAELGRFSVEYRKVFGESPSATLRLALAHARHRGSAPVPRDRDSRGTKDQDGQLRKLPLLYPDVHLRAGSQGDMARRAANTFLGNAA